MSTQQNIAQNNVGCGTGRIVGCRFSLYPMSDQFVSIILNAINETNTSKVWLESDSISTCVRGKMNHVFDVVQSIYQHAASSKQHVVFSATFSIGCPGDTAGDSYMDVDDTLCNEVSYDQEAKAQFALYPLGEVNYMDTIYSAMDIAEKRGTFAGGVHYASQLQGYISKIFDTLQEVFQATTKETNHVVMTATIGCNSPSEHSKNSENSNHSQQATAEKKGDL
ncbi:uncharacterized protein YqgV (UPF0045/DUF77 family) [Paenibacillus turicensis]|uniref:Uncharacterized protein YqgV (UPF0045/DUF77 family) n=1 Tax=Paenibacillus turicensis TaxID=160487 RepID=A0ABS4FR05_9BACL|nr:YkoF family thiamine/hydroxymethylpyrimidine-binding protein [Paenibacillus turicensis]MBP1905012.1 uncharacterized protein YqgV (UPF0045/DUF77 family) [Paenibacillus turicensis]